jgi:hypothetical protein
MLNSFKNNVLNTVHCDAVGVSLVRLHHQSVQVNHLINGNAVLTFCESGRDSVLFHLTPAQCQHMAALLLGTARQATQPESQEA